MPLQSKPKRVLIVEDDALSARVAEKILGRLGYSVRGVVATGEDALDAARALAPDMVLMDINLAGAMDGVTAAKDIIDIVKEFSIPKPNLEARFLVTRLFPNTMLGAEVKEALTSFDIPVLDSAIRNRTEYAKAARVGMTALETEPNGQAAREVRAVVAEVAALLNGTKEGNIHVVAS